MNKARLLARVALMVAVASSAFAQNAPAPAPAAPASAPAATQPPPHRVSIPNGFKQITINGRKAIVDPADEAWVTTALGKMPATTKPATQPANIIQKLRAERDN